MIDKSEQQQRFEKLIATREERVSDLRKSIDKLKRLKRAYTQSESYEQLSLHYGAVPADQGGFEYNKDDLLFYLEDYILRDINTAEDFITMAVFEAPQEAEKCLGDESFKVLLSDEIDKLKKIRDLINETLKDGKLKTQDEELAERYLGLGDKPIIFSIRNLNRYLDDWLRGIGPAEQFIIEALNSHCSDFIQTFKNRKELKTLKKLLDFFLTHYQQEDTNLVLGELYSHVILNSSFAPREAAKEIAAILGSSFDRGISSQLLKNKLILDRIFNTNAYLNIANINLLTEVCICLEEVYKNEVAKKVFYVSLLPEAKDKLDSYVQLLININQHRTQMNNVNKDNTIDYYIASMLKDKASILDLAISIDATVFRGLLISELRNGYPQYGYTTKDSHSHYNERKAFFHSIFSDPLIEQFKFKKECLEEMLKLFPKDVEAEKQEISNKEVVSTQKIVTRKKPRPVYNDEFKDDSEYGDNDQEVSNLAIFNMNASLKVSKSEEVKPIAAIPTSSLEPKRTSSWNGFDEITTTGKKIFSYFFNEDENSKGEKELADMTGKNLDLKKNSGYEDDDSYGYK